MTDAETFRFVVMLWAITGLAVVPEMTKFAKTERRVIALIVLGGPAIWLIAVAAFLWMLVRERLRKPSY